MKNYFILRRLCSLIYISGTGNYWFEPGVIPEDNTVLYRFYSTSILAIYGLMTILEILGAVIGNFPAAEQSDCVTFAISHTIVITKIISVIFYKKKIRQLNQDMVNVCEKYEEMELMSKKYKMIRINIIAYIATVYGSVFGYIFDGIRKMLYGPHFVTIVTYYPTYEDNSTPATIVRFISTVILCLMMITMILSVDGSAMVHLIILKYKFISLRHYLEKIREEFDRDNVRGNEVAAAEKLSKKLIEGLVMHEQLLRLTKDIDTCFGIVMTLQIGLSSGTAVSLLLQLALSDQLPFFATLKIILFVAALFFLLALFLCNAGEITHEASLLSNSIFYCGWHASTPLHRKLRRLMVQAVSQVQRPIVLKAFKMLELTYATFLLVVRTTYSIFALFYARNK